MKCDNLYDMFLAMKSSGIIMEMMSDYEDFFDENNVELIFRKWYKLD